MNNNYELCPFSKPILGKWCQCQHAKLVDRCSGKMKCTRLEDLQKYCLELDSSFKMNSRFILGLNSEVSELTHAQLMKIRCGGFLGMQRVLNIGDDKTIDVRSVIAHIIKTFGNIEQFPYNEIVQDIKNFKHRK